MDSPNRLPTPETLQAAIEFFSDPDRSHAYMVQMRWPDGVVKCPICNMPDPRYLSTQRRFECRKKHPRRQFSVKVGTIFEDSPIALKSWLLAVWQITNCKNGISSYELARALGVTQKTAWFMNHRIRLAMQNDDGGTLGGEVEVDETYIGGKARKMNTGRRKAMLNERTMTDAQRFAETLQHVTGRRVTFEQPDDRPTCKGHVTASSEDAARKGASTRRKKPSRIEFLVKRQSGHQSQSERGQRNLAPFFMRAWRN